MLTFELRRHVFWGLVVSFVLVAVVGCQSETPPRTHTTTDRLGEPSSAVYRQPITAPEPREVTPRFETPAARYSHGKGAPEMATRTRIDSQKRVRKAPANTRPRRRSDEAKDKDDDFDRHPAKWREKLKAKYASSAYRRPRSLPTS